MKGGYGRRSGVTVMALGLMLVALAAGACSAGDDETVNLLEDPKIGLSHLNAELHTIKGDELLSSPTIGLAHLNDELHLLKDPKVGLAHLNDEMHTIRELAADPKVGFEHLNSELHAVKEMLSELSQKMDALEQKVQ